MQNNLHEQFNARYTLRTGETWESHSVYLRSLELFQPIPKNLVQRTRICVMMDSTVACDLQYDNVVPDVMVVTMPLSRLPEMAELAVAKFAPKVEGSLKEPPPKRYIIANLIDKLACEDLFQDLPRIQREMPNREAARNEVAQVLHPVATTMKRTTELLRTQLSTPALFVSPPGTLYWGSAFQHFVKMLSEVCAASRIKFYMCAPNLRVGQDDLRLQHYQSTRIWQRYSV